jgi:CubicO group peptidase (beta-lactamase class C family)
MACILALLIAGPGGAQTSDDVTSSSSNGHLARIQQFIDGAVADRRTGAAIAMIAEGGERWIGTAGEVRPGVAMREDAIVPLASVGKMFTATAAMILYERGTVGLDDPVGNYIPEFADLRIESVGSDGETTLVPPYRPVTIRHLLTHTGGLHVRGDDYWPVFFRHAGQTTTTLFSRALAAMPMQSQPGERYDYGNTGGHYEVLGAVIEVASGQTLEDFLTAHVFAPLGMGDSYFYLPDDELERRPTIYPISDGTIDPARAMTRPYPRSTYFFGGGGVESTAADLDRFARMLHEGGEVGGTRILRPETVRLMMQDHLGPLSTLGDDWSWGFGAAVRNTDASRGTGVPDQYGWSGGGFARLWIDPARDLTAFIAFPLVAPGNPELLEEFSRLVYPAGEAE